MANTTRIVQELRELFVTPRHTDSQRMRLAELWNHLDSALSNGGRLPDQWESAISPITRVQADCSCGEKHSLPLCKPIDNDYCKHGSN